MSNNSFTMEKLKAAMELIKDMPPAPEFYSSRRYPNDRGYSFYGDRGQNIVLAHPDYWQKVYDGLPVSAPYNNVLSGCTVIDLDDPLRGELLLQVERNFIEQMGGKTL